MEINKPQIKQWVIISKETNITTEVEVVAEEAAEAKAEVATTRTKVVRILDPRRSNNNMAITNR